MSITRLQLRLARDPRLFWGGLAVVAALLGVVVALSPSEQTLGTGIRSVYVHVGFSVSGALGIAIAGVLGLVSGAFGKPAVQQWSNASAWVGLGFFIAGFVFSVVAAYINWGAVFWQEPRTIGALQIIALGLFVQTAHIWRLPYRLQGLLAGVVAAFMFWALETAPLVLHPRNAARDSESRAIQLTFLAVLALCVLAATWIALRLRAGARAAATE